MQRTRPKFENKLTKNVLCKKYGSEEDFVNLNVLLEEVSECGLNQNESLILKYASLTTNYGIVKKQVYFGIKF